MYEHKSEKAETENYQKSTMYSGLLKSDISRSNYNNLDILGTEQYKVINYNGAEW